MDEELVGDLPGALTETSDSPAPTSSFASAPSTRLIATFVGILLYINLTGDDQGSLPTDGSDFLSLPLIPTPGKHTVKDLPGIMKLCREAPGTVKAFAAKIRIPCLSYNAVGSSTAEEHPG